MSEQNPQPFFNMQRIYLKDLSLEQPNSPEIFLSASTPAVEIEVNIEVQAIAEGLFESMVTATVTAKADDKVAFIIEAKQAGIFEIRHVPSEELDPLLHIACPTIIFPYLRANIADAVTRASFPPIHLVDINFQAIYEQHRSQAAQAAANPIELPKAAQEDNQNSAANDDASPSLH